MHFKVGDIVCNKSEHCLETCRVYQIYKIEGTRVEAMGIMEWRCNPQIRWGRLAIHSRLENIAHYPEMLVIARVVNGEHICERPKHFIDKGVWTQQDYDEITYGKRYP